MEQDQPRLIYLATFGKDLAERANALTLLVVDLMMEVEALREAMIEESRAKGIVPKDSEYGKAYYATALLTHNAAGPSSGLDKLLWRFLPRRVDFPAALKDIDLREALMLIRLGYSVDEIRAYAIEAEEAEMRT